MQHSVHVLLLQEWLYFGVWRWCIFFAGMGPIYFLAELLVHMLFLFAESHFFTLRYAFYYAVSVKVGTDTGVTNNSCRFAGLHLESIAAVHLPNAS